MKNLDDLKDDLSYRTRSSLRSALTGIYDFDEIRPSNFQKHFGITVSDIIPWMHADKLDLSPLCYLPDAQLLRIPNFGRKSLRELRQFFPFKEQMSNRFYREKTVSVTEIPLRDYFAAAALTGLLANQKISNDVVNKVAGILPWYSETSYKMADLMLKERAAQND